MTEQELAVYNEFNYGASDEATERAWQPEALGPMTAEEADEYLTKRDRLERDLSRIDQQARRMKAPIHAELNELNGLHAPRLERYIRDEFDKTGAKTFNFWGGTCKIAVRQPQPILEDERAALSYLQDNAEALERFIIPPAVRKGDYQKYAKELITESGEVPPGIGFTPQQVTFSINLRDKGDE